MKKIYLYTAPDGTVPFLRFLAITDEKMRSKLLYALKCLVLFPDRMTEPYVKHFSIERYKNLYELRERIRILVRIILTFDKDGNIIILHPFVKKHDRNTVQALESSLRMLNQIDSQTASLTEYQWKGGIDGEKVSENQPTVRSSGINSGNRNVL